MLYVLLFIAVIGGLIVLKIAAGIIRIVLIGVLLLIIVGVGFATDQEKPGLGPNAPVIAPI